LKFPWKYKKITADENIKADIGKVALRYGPLIYSVETADQPDINVSLGSSPLSLEWRDNLLEGVMIIKGNWADGFTASGNTIFLWRNNRMGESR